MKIIITGHTSPIGSALYKHYSNQEVQGISRQTGHDLTNKDTLKNLVELVLDSDIFINLANVGQTQIQLLNLIEEKWNMKHKLKNVITFGSLATQLDSKILAQAKEFEQYIKTKQQLDYIHKILANKNPFGKQIKYTLLRLLNYGTKTGVRAGEPTCTAEDICRTVDYIINESMYIGLIDFRRY
jgi:hypothetical protein